MQYTDKELIKASQIAYFNIGRDSLEEVYRAIGTPQNTGFEINYTLSNLFKHSETFRKSAYKDICTFTNTDIDDYEKFENLTPKQIEDYGKDDVGKQMILFRAEIIEEIKNGKIGSWKVVSYVDNNTIGTPGMAGKLVNGTWVHNNFSGSGAMIIL